ncbi:ATP-dependent helicase HrpB [Paraglaciecola sp. L3A3]|uniref:ATP-dependent helicase HrpB n=1 Tax=Paraglaciecola sp. L3A3 TaxID=2686358 RepID=UPI00131D8059|nr:ATP-dependent helicase HrpB [Paraglaciecola sp. L3A3]
MLPVQHILSDLHAQLAVGDSIVVAPPGAGKSTCLPLSLLNLDIFANKKIILLQPRRIAARNIATYLAQQVNEPVGQTIGYRIRGEHKVSANTRLEIVTEGVLTRMLQNEPELPDVALVIFDEFHERSIHADFSLALCIEVQQALRDDLRLLVMSATLDVAAISQLLPEAKVFESLGRSYPVDIVYRPTHSSAAFANTSIAESVSRLIIDIFAKHQKDGLVFLPGAAEINKAAQWLEQYFLTQATETHATEKPVIHRLYSDQAKNLQDAALLPDPDGKRKIVLATNIAETSLTIDGIEWVVDSGIEKTAIYHLNRGVTHLQNRKISQASAVQRAGRAGRLAPGTCYRLWSKEQQDRLAPQSTAEILQSDMSSFILESAVWGAEVKELNLIDYPSDAQLAQGQHFLNQLDLFDSKQNLTSLGRQVHALGCNASIAVMLLKSEAIGVNHLSLACALAALFENKDPIPRNISQTVGAEISVRLHYLLKQKNHAIWQSIRQWHRKFAIQLTDWPFTDVAILVGFAYPQWLAKQRSGESYQLANGAGATLRREDALLEQKWLAIGLMQTSDKQQGNAQIRFAESISLAQIEQHFSSLMSETQVLEWDDTQQKITAHKRKVLGKIVVYRQPMAKPSAEQIENMWQQVITKKGISALPFDEDTWQLIYRVRLATKLNPELKLADFSEQGLLNSIEQWLLPYLSTKTSWQQLTQCQFSQQLKSQLDYQQQQTLDKFLPEKISLPSGRSGRLIYTEHDKIVLSVRIQEMYGMLEHPVVCQGRIAITIELLSPAQRPIQTTQDLPGFWLGSYKQVQKEMKGRYPRHFWPDSPATSPATTTTKKRMNFK